MVKLTPRHAPVLLAFFTSLLMSLLMSAVITLINLGPVEDFFRRWMTAWITAFVIAFPSILLVLPVARRIVARLTGAPLG
ncbi:MAG: DUF2798 domain-containing protein [Desulfurivibrio sp.]